MDAKSMKKTKKTPFFKGVRGIVSNYYLNQADFIMLKNESAIKQAPPTSAPSIFFCDKRSFELSGFTLPPYKMLKFSLNSLEN